jgi:hypothetical protein
VTDQPQAELLTSKVGDGRETEPECPHTDSLGERLHLWDIVESDMGERLQVSVDLSGWCLVSQHDGTHWAFDDEAFDEIRLVRGCVEAPELLTSKVERAGDGTAQDAPYDP